MRQRREPAAVSEPYQRPGPPVLVAVRRRVDRRSGLQAACRAVVRRRQKRDGRVRCGWRRRIHGKEIVPKASTAVRAAKHHGNAPIRLRPSAHLSCATPNVKNESAIEINVQPAMTAGAPSKARFPNHEVPSHSTMGGKCRVTMADTPTQPGGITNTDTINKTIVVCAQVGNCSSCKGMIFIKNV
jgi:hypothetical protein